ncbi:MmgE/PrpD family protein [Nocardiopsis salina]|uniref:MmgE/PrpD family protein n=1 Tax=Nocardiopsis salina TaxID=245836 RepID=UPI000345EB81|nr:MmgE/PrpD family protein [Nocardiopsis salina]
MSAPRDDLAAFVHETGVHDLPAPVVEQTRRCVADLVGTAAAGARTRLSHVVRDHAHRHQGGPQACSGLWFDGRVAAPAGAALANAATIDAMDAHDGHRLAKGHAGAAVLPGVVAFSAPDSDVGELLAATAVGYEVALRAGLGLHALAGEHHSSGAWNALGVAAVGARALGLGAEATEHALGIAEYHGPRGPMMRCIDHPTMVKDSSAPGAQAGAQAALLAKDGFTGAPAQVLSGTGSQLGRHWHLLEQYFKPHPVCRWAQPAVSAVLGLVAEHGFRADDVVEVQVGTFHEAVRLDARDPSTTEQAQYSLPFPVALGLVHGYVPPEAVADPSSADSRVHEIAAGMRVVESAPMSACFPGQRWADATVDLADGRRLASGPVTAPGDPEDALSESDLRTKFHTLAEPTLGRERTLALRGLLDLPCGAPAAPLLGALTQAPPPLPRPGAEVGHAPESNSENGDG